jgi:hypothetical protein
MSFPSQSYQTYNAKVISTKQTTNQAYTKNYGQVNANIGFSKP